MPNHCYLIKETSMNLY